MIYPADQYPGTPSFVAVDRIVLSGTRKLSILDRSGKVVARRGTPRKSLVGSVQASSNGKRFAVTVGRFRGGSDFFDIPAKQTGLRIDVYNVDQDEPLTRLEVTPFPVSEFNYALSPDGNLLAVLVDGIIKLFRIR